MLKFLVDHNVPYSVAVFLKKKKYDIKLVKDIDAEMRDVEVIALAVEENRIILSNDKDFLDLAVKYDKADMVLFDFINQSAEVRIAGLRKILPQLRQPCGVIVLQ